MAHPQDVLPTHDVGRLPVQRPPVQASPSPIRVITPGTTVVEVSGDLDAATSPAVWVRLSAAPPGDLVIDLSAVTFMGVAGLRLLLRLREHRGPTGATLRLAAAPSCVHRLIGLAGLVTELPIWPSVAEAVADTARFDSLSR
ncbi:STAS domain-containing protein [Actinokineospora xionganensis]|uniref:STAS domain-containing protein n=1 Tax=Actinokineospora xionganensis TaxID=2684470 RepID=A0ABR7LED3_9PSEU|nr:STAS domain-containing protein [Actinokineospora xionganensis]MBC6451078.1 STAS domain-containing protein [Actinokineospora xionganensis]